MTNVFDERVTIRVNKNILARCMRAMDKYPEKYPRVNGDYNFSLYFRVAIVKLLREDGEPTNQNS